MSNPGDPGPDLKAETDRILQVLKKHKTELLSKPNVVGVAVGFQRQAEISTQNLALVVMVDQKIPSSQLPPGAQIPESLDGVLVDVQEIGRLDAH
jgi:hypothetical protein